MMNQRRYFLHRRFLHHHFMAWLLLCLLAGCETPAKEHHHNILSFGTLIDVTLYDVDETQADKIFTHLDEQFKHWHDSWSPWLDSELSRINKAITSHNEVIVSPDIQALITESISLSKATNYLFNPAIGQLINLWAFHKYDQPDVRPPAAAQLKKLLENQPRLSDLKFTGNKMLSENPSVQLNFGAFAKGYAIDQSMQYLKKSGVSHAILNTGGDLKAIGQHGDRAWRIGIRHPRQQSIMASIETQGEEGIFTSGDYERFYMHQGKRYHHILDPRTAYPASGTQSVTVIHHNSGLADAAATALFIAGPAEWLNIAQNLNLTQVMLIDDKGVVHITPEMQKRVKFNHENEITIIVTAPL